MILFECFWVIQKIEEKKTRRLNFHLFDNVYNFHCVQN